MEVHRQTCQNCQSRKVQDILVREAGEPAVVYVRCAQCGELVARYVLSDYYHHGKDLDSYLRSQAAQSSESGRDMLEGFRKTQTEALEGYLRALDYIRDSGKDLE